MARTSGPIRQLVALPTRCGSLIAIVTAALLAGCGGGDGDSNLVASSGASAQGGAVASGAGGAAGSTAGHLGGTSSAQAGWTSNQSGSAARAGTSASASGGTVATNGGATNGGATNGGATNGRGGSGTGGRAVGSTGGKSPGSGGNTGGSNTGGSTGGANATSGNSSGGTTGGGAGKGGTTGGGASGTSGVGGARSALTIYIAGDSTVSTYTNTSAPNDQAGWGQMLKEIFDGKVTVVNRAAGGRTAYWFYLEGAAANILNAIKPGDYFFIQFGTNDQNTTATFTVNGTTYPRYADPQTTWKTQLKQYYLDPTRAKGAIPVLVTPPPRNSAYCNGGNGLSAYATAMKELGAAENVAVLDNNLQTFNYLKAICPKPTVATEEKFFKNDAGTIDGTHFQENGARKMAGFIGEEIRRINLGLAAYLL